MHFSSQRPHGLAALGLAALGLAALAPIARAQTQDLFVSTPGSSTISRFAGTGPGTFSTTAKTLSAPGLSNPNGLAFDARGDLFASDVASITEFTAGATPGTFGATTTLRGGGLNQPFGLAVDARGDLFAVNNVNNSITEFPAEATPGTFGVPTNLTGGGLSGPFGLAFDARGDLFASNVSSDSITEFTAGATPGTFGAPVSFTRVGLSEPTGLAFDARGDLFAANNGDGSNGAGSITEFTAGATPGTFATVTTLAGGLNQPLGLAVDARGDLFAASNGNNSILEFAVNPMTGVFGAAQTVESGLSGPTFLAFGPSAPVPEASTTLSLGLLLALGMGGVVVAARRKRKA